MRILEECLYIAPCGFCYKFDKFCESSKRNRETKIKVENHDGCVGCDN